MQRFFCLAGCLESLKALLKDSNHMVRIKTTEVLCIMATHNVGRWAAALWKPVSGTGWHAFDDLECSEFVCSAVLQWKFLLAGTGFRGVDLAASLGPDGALCSRPVLMLVSSSELSPLKVGSSGFIPTTM